MKPYKTAHSLGFASLLFILATAGCSTMTIPKYSGDQPKHPNSQENQGLKMVADPFMDKERAEKYFKFDPVGRGVAIIELRAENTNTNANWLLTEENMFLTDSSGTTLMNAHDQGVKSDFAAANSVGMAGAVLISLPMMFAGGKLTSDAMIVQKNFVDNEWHNQTLSPGRSAQGFIYFNLGSKTNRLDTMCLKINCINTYEQSTNIITLPLAYETK